MLTKSLRQTVVYVEMNLFRWCEMFHADPAIAVAIRVGAHMLMVVYILIHRHH